MVALDTSGVGASSSHLSGMRRAFTEGSLRIKKRAKLVTAVALMAVGAAVQLTSPAVAGLVAPTSSSSATAENGSGLGNDYELVSQRDLTITPADSLGPVHAVESVYVPTGTQVRPAAGQCTISIFGTEPYVTSNSPRIIGATSYITTGPSCNPFNYYHSLLKNRRFVTKKTITVPNNSISYTDTIRYVCPNTSQNTWVHGDGTADRGQASLACG